MLQSTCASRKRTGITPRQIFYGRYYEWAFCLINSLKHYDYLEEVLNYIRALVTGTKRYRGLNFRGFLKVSVKEFCKALQIELLQCLSGGRFWKIYRKPLQQRSFLVKINSAISSNIKNAPHHRCFLKLYVLFPENSKMYAEAASAVFLENILSPKFWKIKRGNAHSLCKILEETCWSSCLVKMQV